MILLYVVVINGLPLVMEKCNILIGLVFVNHKIISLFNSSYL